MGLFAQSAVATVTDVVRELRRHMKDFVRCDICDRAPDRMRFEQRPWDLTHKVVAFCAHGAAKPDSDEWRRAAKWDVIILDDRDVIMQPKKWRDEFVFFRRGFSCYPRMPRRGGVRPLPAYERRAMRRR